MAKPEDSMPRNATLSMTSHLHELLQAAIDNQAPKSVVRFNVGGSREIAFVVLISDAQGYLGAIEAYENGRDAFALRTANAVADHIAKNGLPEPGSKLNVVLHG